MFHEEISSRKIVGLNIFQTSVFMFYISIGKMKGGTAPILLDKSASNSAVIYSNPLPHVLILTAIVVGIATTALGLALILKISAVATTPNKPVRHKRKQE